MSSSDELKAVLKKDMGIDCEVGLLERVRVTTICSAWLSAKERAAEEAKASAQALLSNRRRSLVNAGGL